MSEEETVDRFEVAVVGAGMFGSATAKHLAAAGVRVGVIGPSEPPAGRLASLHEFAAHFDEARITRRLGWDDVWAATDVRSLERFRAIEQESGIEFFSECGSLVLMAGSIAERTDSILRRCETEDIEVQRFGESTLRRAFPSLAPPPLPGGVDALFERRQAGYINPRRLVAAQLRLTQARGGCVVRGVVSSVTRQNASDGWRLGVEVGSHVRTVQAEKLVVATGTFTNHNGVLAPDHRLAMHAFTEPNLLFEVSSEQLGGFIGLPPIVTVDPDDTGTANMSTYLLPPIRYPDGRWYLRIGPGMQPIVRELQTPEEMMSWYQRQALAADQRAFLEENMRRLLPDLTPVNVRPACCMIEKTPSRYPYIGHPGDDQDLTVVVGGNGHGARGSDEIGRLGASVALGERWDCPIAQEVFHPLLQAQKTAVADASFLKPPFGLC